MFGTLSTGNPLEVPRGFNHQKSRPSSELEAEDDVVFGTLSTGNKWEGRRSFNHQKVGQNKNIFNRFGDIGTLERHKVNKSNDNDGERSRKREDKNSLPPARMDIDWIRQQWQELEKIEKRKSVKKQTISRKKHEGHLDSRTFNPATEPIDGRPMDGSERISEKQTVRDPASDFETGKPPPSIMEEEYHGKVLPLSHAAVYIFPRCFFVEESNVDSCQIM